MQSPYRDNSSEINVYAYEEMFLMITCIVQGLPLAVQWLACLTTNIDMFKCHYRLIMRSRQVIIKQAELQRLACLYILEFESDMTAVFMKTRINSRFLLIVESQGESPNT
jgi:hypothetical protein